MEYTLDHLDENQQKKRLELVIEGTRLGMWDWNPQTNQVIPYLTLPLKS